MLTHCDPRATGRFLEALQDHAVDCPSQKNITPEPLETSPPSVPCRRCGSLGPHREERGTGPHRAKLVCQDCGTFVKWLATHPPAVRAARKRHYQLAHMASLPVTPAQQAFLWELGQTGEAPTNRAAASVRIEALRTARRKGRS